MREGLSEGGRNVGETERKGDDEMCEQNFYCTPPSLSPSLSLPPPSLSPSLPLSLPLSLPPSLSPSLPFLPPSLPPSLPHVAQNGGGVLVLSRGYPEEHRDVEESGSNDDQVVQIWAGQAHHPMYMHNVHMCTYTCT